MANYMVRSGSLLEAAGKGGNEKVPSVREHRKFSSCVLQ